jgi:anionic cell wall polymer biosynthesis LytR-Cps2A-Psr (LCP) family protein
VRFDFPTRDTHTGLNVPAGCRRMTGTDALAYVRSRYYDIQRPNKYGNLTWSEDPTFDLDRIQRQQQFIKLIAQKAVDGGAARDPLTFNRLLDAVKHNVTVDDTRTNGDLGQLAARMVKLDPNNTKTYTIATDADTAAGQDIERLPTTGAEEATNDEVLRIFQPGGLPPATTIAPAATRASGPSVATNPTTATTASPYIPTPDSSCQ